MTLLDAQALYEDHKFDNALPIPEVIDTSKRKTVTLQVREFDQFLGLYDESGQRLYTTVWGYGAGASENKTGYPGPTLLAYEGQPITVNWQNKLPVDGHLLPVDTSIHVAEPERRPLEAGFVPIVTHLHGGHNRSASDGLPEQWFTQNGGGSGGTGPRDVGPKFVSSSMTYDNDQQAATLWYHDHALGITRLNVYAGLAGFYILQDENRLKLVETGVLPGGPYDIGMAIQDRAFTADGQLYYPAYKDDPIPGTDETVGDMAGTFFDDPANAGKPTVLPEFFGDTIMVNGMAWPKLDVAAGDYQFRMLNGSDSRFYVLKVDKAIDVHLVGTDGGLLPEAMTVIDDGVGEIVIAPGDRVDLVFDFSHLAKNEAVTLLNVGPQFEPFKGLERLGFGEGQVEPGDELDPVGNIMQFVGTGKAGTEASVTGGTDLDLAEKFVDLRTDANNDDIADRAQVFSDTEAVLDSHVRKLGLFEGTDEFDRVTPKLGKAEEGKVIQVNEHGEIISGVFGPLSFHDETTEKPVLGSYEQWDIFNFTADSHPIHLHLTQYQVLEKREITFTDVAEDGIPDDITGDGEIKYGEDIFMGETIALRPEEMGWQDTVHVDPGTMMSVVSLFDKPGDYVWHCHILSHEDNEMMRPFTVISDPDAIL